MERIAAFIEAHSLDTCIVGDTVVAWSWTKRPDGSWFQEFAILRTMSDARDWLGY